MVKFGEGLKFNGLPDWRDHYINYELLKQLIYDQVSSHGVLAGSVHSSNVHTCFASVGRANQADQAAVCQQRRS